MGTLYLIVLRSSKRSKARTSVQVVPNWQLRERLCNIKEKYVANTMSDAVLYSKCIIIQDICNYYLLDTTKYKKKLKKPQKTWF